MNGPQEIPCHYRELFIRNTGDVYPCCMVWNKKDLRIGHVSDPDILDKIKTFVTPSCRCDKAILRQPRAGERIGLDFLNIEFSLACNATCAMCCVNAPDWRGKYDLYDGLQRIIDQITENGPIREIYVQGGEVLVQKKSLQFLERLKNKFPSTKFSVVTNGSVPEQMRARALEIFDHFTVSIYAFQEETYARLCEVSLASVLETCARIAETPKKSLFVKYLSTPISIHEVGLYLTWASALAPRNIQVVNGGIDGYVKPTEDNYWKKIFHRTAIEVKKSLVSLNRGRLRARPTTISFDKFHSDAFQITPEFLERYDLNGLISPYLDRSQHPRTVWTFPPESGETQRAEVEVNQAMARALAAVADPGIRTADELVRPCA